MRNHPKQSLKWGVLAGSSLALLSLGRAQALAAEHTLEPNTDSAVGQLLTTSDGEQHTADTELSEDISDDTLADEFVEDNAVQESSSEDTERDSSVVDVTADADENEMDEEENEVDESVESDDSAEIDQLFEKVHDADRPLSIIPQGPNITPDNFMDWERPTDDSEAIYQSTVPLADREKGESINGVSSSEAKVISLAYLDTKSDGYSAAGGSKDGMNVYAFDYWQYLDQMVAWEQMIPPVEMIDVSHKNGVSIYGTIFFNWSEAQEDVDIVDRFLEKDEDGHFKSAKKLIDIADFYGFNGYFINQETILPFGGDRNYSAEFISFMSDAKALGKQNGKNIAFAWYDSMTNNGLRHYVNGVSSYNDSFVEATQDGEPVVDHFFMNFDWRTEDKIETTVETMKEVGRDPFDAYAGLELQKGGAYQTNQKTSLIVDEDGKLKLSLGLFVPDSVRGFASDGIDYHNQEDIFWTGHTGDPTKEDGAHDDEWSGISRFVVDKTVITAPKFYTSFNPGHGKYWFVNGEKVSDREWASRSVQTIMPTWRYWITSENAEMKGQYDFDHAFHGGASLQFTGKLGAGAQSDMMLYATNFKPTESTSISITHQSTPGATLALGVATTPDYQEESMHYFELETGDRWVTSTIDLSDLKDETIYALKLRITSEQGVDDYAINLGQLAIIDSEGTSLEKPETVTVRDQRLFSAQEAEAIIQVTPVDDADTYEVYQENNGEWGFVNASTNSTIYLPFLTRSDDFEGTTQRIAVIAIGKDGAHSEPTLATIHWGLPVTATTEPQAEPKNIMLEVQEIDADRGENSEKPENMLTGTITSTSDKWFYDGSTAEAIVTFDESKTVVQYHIDHAGAGGEDVEKKLMNTKDFNLEYYDEEKDEWIVASEVRDNRDDVTDIILDQPITAKKWKLNILAADNGSPWGGVRIYNWKMYETVNNETKNLPMAGQEVVALSEDNHYAVRLTHGEPRTTVTLYRQFDKETQTVAEEIATAIVDENGYATFTDIELPEDQYYVFYQATAEGMEPSNVLALIYGDEPVDIPEEDDTVGDDVIEDDSDHPTSDDQPTVDDTEEDQETDVEDNDSEDDTSDNIAIPDEDTQNHPDFNDVIVEDVVIGSHEQLEEDTDISIDQTDDEEVSPEIIVDTVIDSHAPTIEEMPLDSEQMDDSTIGTVVDEIISDEVATDTVVSTQENLATTPMVSSGETASLSTESESDQEMVDANREMLTTPQLPQTGTVTGALLLGVISSSAGSIFAFSCRKNK